ncbi:MAG: GH3 auxin-responsive promoter family protein, partial [Verrucomicrobiales bacterium]
MNLAPVMGCLTREATRPAYEHFLTELNDPAAVQERLLRWITRDASLSAYGTHHGLCAQDDTTAFAEKIPIVTYEDLRPWIERAVFAHEPRVFSSHPIVRVEPTSGSSSGMKWIPYTRPMMGTFSRMFTLWAHDLLRETFRPRTGRLFLCVTGGAVDTGSISPRHVGDDRDYLGPVWRHVLDRFVVAPRFAGTEDPIPLLAGVLTSEPDLELMSFWSPSLLLSVVDHLGLERPEETRRHWPRLQLISCWTAASSALFMDRLTGLFPHVRFQGKGLLATEAALTIPLERADGYVPLLNDVYLEFLDENGTVRKLHEIKDGTEHEILISNRSGLLRYRLGDRVRVTGFHRATPLLNFIGRSGIVSDLVGEKLTLEFVERQLVPAIGSYFCLLPAEGGYQIWL